MKNRIGRIYIALGHYVYPLAPVSIFGFFLLPLICTLLTVLTSLIGAIPLVFKTHDSLKSSIGSELAKIGVGGRPEFKSCFSSLKRVLMIKPEKLHL